MAPVKAWHLLIALQALAAAIGLFGLASFVGDHLLDPAVPRPATIALGVGFFLIIGLTAGVIGALAWKRGAATEALFVLGGSNSAHGTRRLCAAAGRCAGEAARVSRENGWLPS